ncbi:MAG: ABC transporter ATP-binding protein [Armatimonadetes bacterium]|nr:ABC transporter ATP-binding protein [Armatimonadota bacterium]
MSAAIEIINLCISYRRGWWMPPTVAVAGLNLRVAPGEVVGFIGPNGAGKSSTIKALMGFLAPDAGAARLLGREAGHPESRRRVGFLPEVALYYPWLTARETLTLYGRLQDLPVPLLRAQTQDLLVRVGLAGREDERLRGFSKGMLQRVGIAQALLGNPELLVLDEVSSGLDPLGRRDLREILTERKRAGVTIFFSSHELSEVAQLCDRVVLIHHGRVAADRRVDELRSALRRYWVRFRASEPPLPATRVGEFWEAEFGRLAEWRQALERLRSPLAEVVDAGEREGILEDYFVRVVDPARRHPPVDTPPLHGA